MPAASGSKRTRRASARFVAVSASCPWPREWVPAVVAPARGDALLFFLESWGIIPVSRSVTARTPLATSGTLIVGETSRLTSRLMRLRARF